MEFLVERKAGLIKFDKEKMLRDLEENLAEFRNIKLENEEDLTEFKLKRAGLNKVKKVIDDERKRIKKEYSQPLKEFEEDVKELTHKIDEVNENIGSQIKEVEDKLKQEKLEFIESQAQEHNFNDIEFDVFFDERWLNKTFSNSKIEVELTKIEKQISDDLETIKTIESNKKNQLEIEYDYKKTLDLNRAIKTFKEKQKVVNDNLKNDIKKDNKTYEISLKIKGTKEQLRELKDFLEENNIKHERIKK